VPVSYAVPGRRPYATPSEAGRFEAHRGGQRDQLAGRFDPTDVAAADARSYRTPVRRV